MPLHEKPHKCDNCGNELLLDIGKLSRYDSFRHGVSPGELPRAMGSLWACYQCISCGFIGPWKKQYTMSPQLQQEYKQILTFCKESFKLRKNIEKKLELLDSVIDANKTLQGLPGAAAGLEESISQAVEPLIERIQELEKELQRRKGGRPRKKTTTKKDQ